MILRYAYHQPFKIQLPNKHEWQNGFNSDNKGGLVWYMDRFKTNTNYDTRMYNWNSQNMHSFSLGLHTKVCEGRNTCH
jgi:hypothetical protein